jgi:hypothetical protein
MAHSPSLHRLPLELDPRDPDFARQCGRWAHETRCEMQELVALTHESIARSRALLVDTELMLARR